MKQCVAYLLSLGLIFLPVQIGFAQDAADQTQATSDGGVTSGGATGANKALGLPPATIGGIAVGVAVIGIALAAGGGGGGGSDNNSATGTTP